MSKKVELSEIEKDKFYEIDGQIMTGSELWAYLEVQEPTLDTTNLQIEEIEPTREDLTGEKNND